MDEMEFRRVKFYSLNDWSLGGFLDRIVTVIENFSEDADIEDINEIIELYNIQLFFANGIFHRDWTAQQIDDYKKAVNKFSKAQGVFFAKMPIDQLDDILSTVQINYTDNFWHLIAKYKVYKRISSDAFQKLMRNNKFSLWEILGIKELANVYSEEIISYMENNMQCVEWLLDQYLAKSDRDRKPLYFPNALDEKNITLIEKYIESDIVNLNYLQLIYNSNGSKEFPLPPSLKLKAKRKHQERRDKLFQNSPGFKYGVSLSFDEEQGEISDAKYANGILKVSYGTKWISENLDFATLLNNFIYLFGYTDLQFRCCHVHRESALGTMEKLVGVRGKREYVTGIVFVQAQNLAQLQMIAYVDQLNRYNIQLEDIIKWFFTDYLQKEFNVTGFVFHPSTKDASYREKCRNIAPEMDSILKQFQLYCQEGEIDPELLHMSNEHILIKNIPSMIENKYIYPCGDDYKRASQLFFSEQSNISYIGEISKPYKTFYKLIMAENITLAMFKEWEKPDVEWLIMQDFLFVDKDGNIKLVEDKVLVLHDLYEHDVLCCSYTGDVSDVIAEFKNKGMIEFESSLFSRPEQDYYNYLFNKREFDNGLDIRNHHSHGTQVFDEKINENDYFVFLRIFILIVIKINEEFCLINGWK